MKTINSFILSFVLSAFFLASCNSPGQNNSRFNVLATTTFLADIAQNVAGDRVHINSLLPAGADPHGYQPVPLDVAKINESKLLIVNGLGYEHFLTTLLQNAGGDRTIVTASDGLQPRTIESEDNPGEIVNDPHMWLDPTRVITYVENIRKGLTVLDPDGAAVYKANADAYVEQLTDLDAWAKSQVSQIPVQKRLLVTNHDALGYFADHYEFTLVGAVLPSVSDDTSTSAKQMAKLVDQIKSNHASAIFLDEVENPVLAQQIANETGVKIVGDLHLESLTKDAPADTYIDMMKYNVSRIVQALK